MKAIILSAGQGSRLLPLTEGKPKCLFPIGPRTLIEWQIWALTQGGVDDIAVVVGYHARDVQDLLKRLEGPKLKIRTIFNPFYKLADNLASCWMARHEMGQDFVILNGDTVIEPKIFQHLLASPAAPITVTIDKKESLRFRRHEGASQRRKAPRHRQDPAARAHRRRIHRHAAVPGEGPKLFTQYLDDIMHTPEGLKWWYLCASARSPSVPTSSPAISRASAGAKRFPRRPRAREQAGRGLGLALNQNSIAMPVPISNAS